MQAIEKSLRGRPIGLKANMTKEEMKFHLLKIKQQWKEEGFSEEEVNNAIISKCKPLVYGFYWHRFPYASQTLEEVLNELGLEIERTIQDSMRKLRKVLKTKKQYKYTTERIKKFLGKDYLEQF